MSSCGSSRGTGVAVIDGGLVLWCGGGAGSGVVEASGVVMEELWCGEWAGAVMERRVL